MFLNHEIFISSDLNAFNRVISLFEQKQIKYKTKVDSVRNRLASNIIFGVKTVQTNDNGISTPYTYKVYVDSKDAEQAEYLVRTAVWPD